MNLCEEVLKEDEILRQQLTPEETQSTQTQPQTETQTGNAGGTALTSAADQSRWFRNTRYILHPHLHHLLQVHLQFLVQQHCLV